MSEAVHESVVRQIERLLTAFGHAADAADSNALAELFLVDGVLHVGQQTISGRDAIARFNAARFAAAPARKTRHLWTNLRVESPDAETLTTFALQQTYEQSAPDGPAELRVSDLHDTFRRDEDGQWRFASRSIQRVFVVG